MSAEKTVLLLGAGGQLGSALRRLAPADWRLVTPPRREIDLTSPAESLEKYLDSVSSDLVIHASAYNAVEKAESDRSTAYALNASVVGTLADWCRRTDGYLVHFSTDYVFPGDRPEPIPESAPVSPLNTYGLSKAAGEERFQAGRARGCLIRTSAVFGHRPGMAEPHNFIEKIIHQASKMQPFSVRCDLHFSPTWADDLARFAIARIAAEETGIFHCTSRGETTWHDWARFILSRLGLDPDLASPSEGAPAGAVRRPAHSVLANTRAPDDTLLTWNQATELYLSHREKHG
jgi:dTDP-4-dehydrorhamnose reductase